jgi:hypothetical protein
MTDFFQTAYRGGGEDFAEFRDKEIAVKLALVS